MSAIIAPAVKQKDKECVCKRFEYQGCEYEVTGRTEEEAYENIGMKKAALMRGEGEAFDSMTVGQWSDAYVETYITPRVRAPGEHTNIKNTLTEKSARMYREKLEGHLLPAIGTMRLTEVRAIHLQRVLNGQAGKSFSHVNKLKHVIQQLFHRAYIDRIISFDPSQGLIMPRVIKRTRRSLSEMELSVLHEVAAGHPHGLWVEFHLRFGLREGEVPPLLVQDLDFLAHRLRVTKAIESGSGVVKEPKTAAGVRAIPIPRDFEPALLRYTAGRQPTEHLFPSDLGGMMTQSGINRRWRTFKRAMDIAMGAQLDPRGKVIPQTSCVAKDLTLHCLRHTYCTELGAKGIDASIARFVTGHADVATLANIYTHSNESIIQLIADKLNETE